MPVFEMETGKQIVPMEKINLKEDLNTIIDWLKQIKDSMGSPEKLDDSQKEAIKNQFSQIKELLENAEANFTDLTADNKI